MSGIPIKSQIRKGTSVSIETKDNQGTGKLTIGIVKEILTSSESHPYGIKVRLQDGNVGRVKQIIKSIQKSLNNNNKFVELDKKEIPKVEDKHNEFKEFYQYDPKIENEFNTTNTNDKISITNIKHSVLKRFVTAICSFGNDRDGGFVYLGIKSDGTISGLEKDKRLEKFADYDDLFANHIRDKLNNFLRDRVFIVSKIQIKFQNINDKTICIIQVLPADTPLYINDGNEALFFVRGPSPRAEKLDGRDQVRYIRDRFPDFK
jgi:uncharacterized repeat protein (TIGR03833 family)